MTEVKSRTARNKVPTRTRKQPALKPKQAAPRKSKAALVREMLGRAGGASLDDLCTATGWQPHTVRATLSGLRKAGHEIDRTRDDAGTSVYRITGTTGVSL